MADISKIKLPDNTEYDIKDKTSGYITSETDPTVPSWAKQSTKPVYDSQEIYAQYTGGYGQAMYVQDALDDIHDYKQDTLVSGTNIKTINNTSLLGSGNINVGLPTVTSSDNGKVLMVVNGQWTATSLPSANGVSF